MLNFCSFWCPARSLSLRLPRSGTGLPQLTAHTRISIRPSPASTLTASPPATATSRAQSIAFGTATSSSYAYDTAYSLSSGASLSKFLALDDILVLTHRSLSFHDPEAEAHYLKERYYTKKRLAFFASLFFILNWVLACALVPRPFVTFDYVFYYGVAPALTIPGPLFIIFDGYRRAPVLYQVWLTTQTYTWAFYNILFIHL